MIIMIIVIHSNSNKGNDNDDNNDNNDDTGIMITVVMTDACVRVGRTFGPRPRRRFSA